MKISVKLQNTYITNDTAQRGENTNRRLLALLQKAAKGDSIPPNAADHDMSAKDR